MGTKRIHRSWQLTSKGSTVSAWQEELLHVWEQDDEGYASAAGERLPEFVIVCGCRRRDFGDHRLL